VLGQAAVVQDQDHVSAEHGGQPVRDDHTRLHA